ncbi:helix-turn-helix domain-containing protein [Paenibacillus hodogayensis]|uniref:Helix-turn-helix domain-containing protein n=1 Tax=Paenibacillus hodogayensis TaxID=279208 RepID=A0ABV5VSR2_9BACL
MKKTVFVRLLLQLTLAVFIVAMVVGAMVFRYTNQLLQETKQEANAELLAQTKKIVEQALGEVQQISNSLALNVDVQKSFLFPWKLEDHFGYLKKTSDLFSERVNSSNYLHSVYLYSAQNQKLLSGSGLSDYDSSPFKASIESFLNQHLSSAWIASRSLSSMGGSEHVVTYLYRFPVQYSQTTGVLVINLKESILYNAIVNTNSQKLGNVAIVNANGELISYQDKSLLGTTFQEAVLEHIHTAGDSSFFADLDGLPTLVSSMTSSFNGWTYLALTPRSELVNHSGQLVVVTLSISLAGLLVGILLMIVVSRRYYRPVRHMVQTISASMAKPATNGRYSDEFSYINDSFSQLYLENESYRVKFEEQMLLMRDHVLLYLLTGSVTNEESALEQLRYYRIALGPGPFAVLALRLHWSPALAGDSSDGNREQLDNEVRFRMRTLCETLLSRYGGGAYVSNFHKQDVIIMNVAPDEPVEGIDAAGRAKALAAALMAAMRAELGEAAVSIGIGGSCNTLADIALSYRESNEALLYERFAGSGSIISIDDLQMNHSNRSRLVHYRQQVERIIHELKSGRLPEALELQEQMIRKLGEDTEAGYNLKNMMLSHMLNSIVMLRMELAGEQEQGGDGDRKLQHALSGLYTPDELRDWFARLLADTSLELQNKRKLNNHDIVRKLVLYVEEHFREPLSLQTLADLSLMNQQYISKLFKEVTGTAFVDYLTDIRFREACRLLTETDESVASIAEQTGFGHKQNLFRTFRKHINLTPSEYRKQAVLERLDNAPGIF